MEVAPAFPVIIAGLRIAARTTVGLVTVTAVLGLGGYGYFILRGLNTFFWTQILVGVVLSVVLATVLDIKFLLLQRLLSPWARRALRPRGSRSREFPLSLGHNPSGPDSIWARLGNTSGSRWRSDDCCCWCCLGGLAGLHPARTCSRHGRDQHRPGRSLFGILAVAFLILVEMGAGVG